ncbi:hypothetical protein [Streptomyces goshikiensis]|uniref:hypothetical protein n=1 Tax=Streptomyces goshikiensis TaxID=1942 RepID=UPI0036BD91C2
MPERTPRRGGRRRDHRQVLDAIAFKYRTGRRGWTCPSTSVRRTGAHNRLRMWAADGAWEGVSPGPVKGSLAGEPADHDLGRSRNGLTTTIHPAADGRCRPLAFVLTPGHAGDTPAFTQTMARSRVPLRVGRPESHRTWAWPTRRTRPGRSAVICGGAGCGR